MYIEINVMSVARLIGNNSFVITPSLNARIVAIGYFLIRGDFYVHQILQAERYIFVVLWIWSMPQGLVQAL